MHWWYVEETTAECMVRCSHFDDHEFVKVFYFVEARLDGNFFNGLYSLW